MDKADDGFLFGPSKECGVKQVVAAPYSGPIKRCKKE
jgi:hypothetical protein